MGWRDELPEPPPDIVEQQLRGFIDGSIPIIDERRTMLEDAMLEDGDDS